MPARWKSTPPADAAEQAASIGTIATLKRGMAGKTGAARARDAGLIAPGTGKAAAVPTAWTGGWSCSCDDLP
jgi:hypothetical protein